MHSGLVTVFFSAVVLYLQTYNILAQTYNINPFDWPRILIAEFWVILIVFKACMYNYDPGMTVFSFSSAFLVSVCLIFSVSARKNFVRSGEAFLILGTVCNVTIIVQYFVLILLPRIISMYKHAQGGSVSAIEVFVPAQTHREHISEAAPIETPSANTPVKKRTKVSGGISLGIRKK